LKRDCRSPKLAASIARNGPPDHSVRLRRTAPDRFDDLFHDFGRIAVRRMFGGEGIFVGDLMIGIVVDERIYLKTGDGNRADFEAEGSKPFTYTRGKERNATSLSYYTVPEHLLDDPEEFCRWARKAHDAALTARAAKAPKRRARK
jgi:DNA transformation protein and related proteins